MHIVLKTVWHGIADNYPTKYNKLNTEHYDFRIGLKVDNAIYEINNWDFKCYEQ
jgi:hypothetical protein